MARVIVVHGLGGTAATMQPLLDALRTAGHEPWAPTLPGHGTRPEGLTTATWVQWLQTLTAWPADVAVGQSMGGSLAIALAASGSVRAAVAINAPAPDPDGLDGLEWQRSRGIEWVDGPPLADGEEGYARLPLAALTQMVEGSLTTDLAAVTVPVLLVTGALDDVVDPFGVDVLAAALRGPVERLSLPATGHVATLGPDRDLLAAAVVGFVERHGR